MLQIKSSVNQVFAFCDLPKAIEKVSAGHNRGKTVVDMMTDGWDIVITSIMCSNQIV